MKNFESRHLFFVISLLILFAFIWFGTESSQNHRYRMEKLRVEKLYYEHELRKQ